jgi:hypothetical protein
MVQEYRPVFNSAQVKLWEVVRAVPGNMLRKMQTSPKPAKGALVASWKTLGRKYERKI